MKLVVCYYGNPVLRKKCAPIEEITDEIRDLARSMMANLNEFRAGALAAPQVGYPIRLFVAAEYGVNEEGRYYLKAPKAYINPKILFYSDEEQTDGESCVSIPGIHEPVTRPYKITIEAQDLDGNRFQEEWEGLNARQLMHENDHLNGVLCVDRIPANRKKAIKDQLEKIKKKYNSK